MKYKVGLLGPSNWAIGSINRFLQKHLGDQGYDVKRFDWDSSKEIWQCFNWSDVFIAEVHMYEMWTRSEHVPYDIRKKGMYVWHHLADIPHLPLTDKIDSRHFTSRIRWEENPGLMNNFFAITKDTKASVKDYYGLDVDMLPVGTEPSFWTQQDIRSIKKIGHVSSPEQGSPDYKLVKRFDMFEDIVEKSGLEGDRVFGKNILTGSYIYKGFDAVVNTSTHEGLPTPLLECAPAKIPFISTKCGIVPQYSSIKTFETVEEAVEILKELNSDEKILRKYVDDVYDDVVPANEYSKLVPEYYVPAIERVIEQNKEKPKEKTQPPCYIILGMHRSSTSMLSGAMHNSGEVFMGKRMIPGFEGNEKGHWENEDFVNVNTKMFAELDSYWDKPPTISELWRIFPKYKEEMKKVVEQAIEDMKEAGCVSWGFKDPRTCITLPLWLEVIDNPRIIGLKRDSMEVAESLNKRNGIPIEKGLELAKLHNDAIDSYDIWK